MSNFLQYLDKYNKSVSKPEPEVEYKVKNNPKVLSLNVELRTPNGAKLVIEKIEEWVSNNFNQINKSSVEKKKNTTYKIAQKKVIKDPIKEVRSHALDILDGISDNPVINEESTNNINNLNKTQFNLNTTAGHASALL